MIHLFLIVCSLHASFAAPQQVFLNEKGVGASFGGYSASAGLGGLLTGDSSQGFLHADANTPHGHRAEAGLQGNIKDGESGVAYANAQSSPSKKSGAVLSGFSNNNAENSHSVSHQDPQNAIQKIVPARKHFIEPKVSAATDGPKRVYNGSDNKSLHAVRSHNSDHVVSQALDIPLGILQSLQQNLGGQTKQVHLTKQKQRRLYNRNKSLHVVRSQSSEKDVSQALNIPVGILQSLQQSLGGLTKRYK